jgi:peptide/nickel transport system permease protein
MTQEALTPTPVIVTKSFSSNARVRALGKFLRLPTTAFAVLVLLTFSLLALVPSLFAPFGENESTQSYFASPNAEHWFGTDQLGRDVLSRVIYGARESFTVGALAVVMGTMSGALLGIVSGYFRGPVDYLAQRIVDVLMSLPGILMALVIATGLGASLFNVSLAIAVAILPTSARVIRGATLSVSSMPYIEASRAIGAGNVRIIARHILPNVAPPIIVIASIQLGFAIIAEASLSYLGLGVPLGTSTWGSMLSGSSLLYVQKAPWVGLAPGIALTLVIVATNLLGDALRDAGDPRMRGR